MKKISWFYLIAAALVSVSAVAKIDTDLLAGLKARAVGPAATSGRISDIEAVVSDPNIIYASAASGGVWKSVNAGLSWQPIFDDQPYSSIGALAVNQNQPDIIWVGTGEGNVRNSTSIGGGMFKSLDAGETWQAIGLKKTERINRIALHPTNPNVAYVAALGTLWSENKERGIYKTEDGGKSWRRILFVDNKTGATDIKMDPSNPNKLYAAMWQFRRWPYRFESGGPGSGLYVSSDGGETWQRKTEEDGLPKGNLGRMVIGIAKSQPKTVYALVEAEKSALIRSDDGGITWRQVNTTTGIANRPFYYSEIEVDPSDPNTLYNIATLTSRSIDGGKSFQPIAQISCCAAGNNIHIDNHTLWINPNNAKHMVLGNDGGIAITQDQGDSWRFVQNLPISQFYHIRVDQANPYNIYGGLQDNGTWRGPGEIWQTAGIRNLHWQEIGFGDGFDAMPYPDDNTRGYAQSQGGYLTQWDLTTGEWSLLRPNAPEDGTELRFNWNAALAQDPFDPATIYYGSQFVHKSTDRGMTWEIISDDLSTNNKDWQRYKDSGGLTPDVTAAENYTAIISIAPSALEPGVIWVGTDDGRIHVTRDGGKTWKSIEDKARNTASNAFIAHIEPSPHKAGTAFIVFDNHRNGDMKTYVNRVDNYGSRFRDISDDTLRGYALSIQQDHVDPNLLFLGTELGLFVSTNAGKDWFQFDQGVPSVSIMDMDIQARENDLVLGTHGRSILIIDDYSALRGLNDKLLNEPLTLLSVTDGQQYTAGRAPSSRFWGTTGYAGDNESYGVVLTIAASGDHLAHPNSEKDKQRSIKRRGAKKQADEELTDQATVEVFDSEGNKVRTFRRTVKQGINRIVWRHESDGSMRMPGNTPKQNADILPGGPEVPPGNYRIKVSLNQHEFEANATVLIDPRHKVTVDDLTAGYAAQRKIVDMFTTLAQAVTYLTDNKNDLNYLKGLADKRLKLVSSDKDQHPANELKKRVDELLKAINELDKNLRSLPNTNGIVDTSYKVQDKIGTASFYVGSRYGRPTPTAEKYVAAAEAALADALKQVNQLLGEEIPALKQQAASSEVGLFPSVEKIEL